MPLSRFDDLIETVARDCIANEVRLGAVGRMLHMEKSTVSRNVERMKAWGWLEAALAEDGRTSELRVSKA